MHFQVDFIHDLVQIESHLLASSCHIVCLDPVSMLMVSRLLLINFPVSESESKWRSNIWRCSIICSVYIDWYPNPWLARGPYTKASGNLLCTLDALSPASFAGAII